MAEVEDIFIAVYEEANSNPEYKQYEDLTRELGRKILNELGEKKDLFFQYEQLLYLAGGLCIESAYRTGVKEGIGIPTK